MASFFRILLISVLFLPSFNGKSQEYNFKTIAFPRGSTWGLVTSIAQDPQDNLWFSSWNGLHKYDGYTFTSYFPDPLNAGSIAASDPQILCASRSGLIWVGTRLGLDRFDPQTGIFTHFKNDKKDTTSLPGSYITAILEDHEGNIWIGTGEGLSLFNKKTGSFINYRHNPSDSTSLSYNGIRVLYEDKKGTLWIGCGSTFTPSMEGGLNRMDRKTGKFTRYKYKENDPATLTDNRVSAMLEDSRGIFWIGTAGDGLHRMDRSTGLFKRLQYNSAKPENLSRSPLIKNKDPLDHITFITEDATGIIWIGTLQGGLSRHDPAKGTVVHYNNGKNNTPLFKDKMFWCGFTSRDGLLWMSTWEGNLYKIDPYRKIFPFHPLAFKVNTVCEENPETMWIGTESKGLIRKNILTNDQKQFSHDTGNPYSISSDTVRCLLKDSEQMLWIGTRQGLNRFDAVKNQFIVYKQDPKNKNSLPGDTVVVIYEDSKKNLWIGSYLKGLSRMETKTGSFIRFTNDPQDSSSISNEAITSIYEDNRHRLWIGTWFGGGLNRMDIGSDKFLRYLSGSNIACIYQDKSGTIWIGTETGLYLLDEPSGNFKPFLEPVSGNKFITPTLGITEDDKRNLWIRARDKIIRINYKRDELKTFGEEWGINTNDGVLVDAMVGRKGNIIFSDRYGYFSFFPDQTAANTNLPGLILTELRVQNETIKAGKNRILNEPLSETKKIRLNYRQNTFSFDFKAVDFRSGGNNQFIFILENYEKEWRTAGGDRAANYYNVPPGDYTFRIKVSGSDGRWAEKAVQIIISPPWWETWWFRVLSVVAIIVIIYALIKERSRKLKAENIRLEEKVAQRTAQLNKSLDELKATQAQLIQSEKMASLGELTTGIAHEIQNPLNFVNNFSEVNGELLKELQTEAEKGNLEEVKAIAKDIEFNSEKINHHGKRADSIVKGMLQHSRTSSGQKDSTDINALADEYLRLAYHGLRAKDKNFNATTHTDFDTTIGKINVVPQDIGRVLLNLYSNAFYAVSAKASSEKSETGNSKYQPTVIVSTSKNNGKIEIKVKDNGNGIPQKIVDKIFQPFFTTKPTGQGTGLGLSLSYDIIKAHGGEIKVHTSEGEGTEFVIALDNT